MSDKFSLIKIWNSKKVSKLNKDNNCYAFFVNTCSNKNDIKHDVESLFNVKVDHISTINTHSGVKKRYSNSGFIYKKEKHFKKAYVFLKKGEQLSFENIKN